jgi:hypothetical protein
MTLRQLRQGNLLGAAGENAPALADSLSVSQM